MKFNEHGMSVLCPYVSASDGKDQFLVSRLRIPAGWDKRRIKRCIQHFYKKDLGITLDARGVSAILAKAVRNGQTVGADGVAMRDKFISALQEVENAQTPGS